MFTIALTFFLGTTWAQAQPNGKEVYRENCASCHLMEGDMTGPQLSGAFERIQAAKDLSEAETMELLKVWIPNAPSLLDSDPYFKGLLEKYGSPMQAFPGMPEDQVLAVIDYIRTHDDCEKWQDCREEGPGDTGPTGPSENLGTMLLILVLALAIIALILGRVTNVLGRMSKEKEGIPIPAEVPIYRNKKVMVIIALIGFTTIFIFAADGAINVNRQQGYQPTQPINFSHTLHAGTLEIDCKYCHVGAARGKQSTIPSLNICMNCHTSVHKGPSGDTTEIAKIHAALGYDKKTNTYNKDEADPIEWVRIHNLPDHVYFNHSQHVDVGELECQECHGAVEEMDVLKQDASLGMGWCLDCHREREVKFEGNEYYTKSYQEYHAQLTAEHKQIDGVTVAMIGGTECQKCHY